MNTPPYTPPPIHHTDRWKSIFEEIRLTLKELHLSENATYNEFYYSTTKLDEQP